MDPGILAHFLLGDRRQDFLHCGILPPPYAFIWYPAHQFVEIWAILKLKTNGICSSVISQELMELWFYELGLFSIW
jgi:hypothetical protein